MIEQEGDRSGGKLGDSVRQTNRQNPAQSASVPSERSEGQTALSAHKINQKDQGGNDLGNAGSQCRTPNAPTKAQYE